MPPAIRTSRWNTCCPSSTRSGPRRPSSMSSPSGQDPLVSAHLRMLRLQKGLSERTVEAYARDLGQFAASLSTKGVSLQAASAEDIRAFLAEGVWRPSTRARKTAAIRSFYKEAVIEGTLVHHPTQVWPSEPVVGNGAFIQVAPSAIRVPAPRPAGRSTCCTLSCRAASARPRRGKSCSTPRSRSGGSAGDRQA